MLLIGQYDSPFVRRIGIALTLYGMPFEHRRWSTFADADKLREFNPLTRVPTLVLDDGTALLDSAAIIDYLDSQVPMGTALFSAREPQRHRELRIAALATGCADKAVSLFYELRLHSEVSPVWVDRCRRQIAATLALLERDCAANARPFWFGERFGHADIAVTVVIRFIEEAHPGLVSLAAYPALRALVERLDALPAFQAVRQVFIPPA